MYEKDFQQVKQLTQEIAQLVGEFNIEACNELISLRLNLLKELNDKIVKDSPVNNQAFIKLLQWIDKQDKIPSKQATSLKKDYQAKLIQQKKANVAIKQYTNLK